MATRERDSKGRFVKKQQSQKANNNENDFHHEVLTTYNRIADGGEEYTIEDARRSSILETWSLRVLAVVFAVFLGWLFFGCTTKKVVEYVPIEKKVTETVTLTDTIVDVQLVPYRDSVSVKDSTSYLKNEYAYSYASLRNTSSFPRCFSFKTRFVQVFLSDKNNKGQHSLCRPWSCPIY